MKPKVEFSHHIENVRDDLLEKNIPPDQLEALESALYQRAAEHSPALHRYLPGHQFRNPSLRFPREIFQDIVDAFIALLEIRQPETEMMLHHYIDLARKHLALTVFFTPLSIAA